MGCISAPVEVDLERNRAAWGGGSALRGIYILVGGIYDYHGILQ